MSGKSWVECHGSNVMGRNPSQSSLSLAANEPERAQKSRLSEADAIDIWIARWLRIRRKDLIARYGCDPRRIYEIWEGVRHPAARAKARDIFLKLHPELADRIDFGPHQRIPRRLPDDGQLTLFSE